MYRTSWSSANPESCNVELTHGSEVQNVRLHRAYTEKVKQKRTIKHTFATDGSTPLGNSSFAATAKRSPTRRPQSMLSPQTRSEEHLEKVAIPDGTEKVVNIRKVQQASDAQMNKMTPLSVHTGYSSSSRTSEMYLEELKCNIRRRSKSSGQKKSARESSRRSQVILGEGNSSTEDRRQVVSCVDLTAPEPAEINIVFPGTGEEESTLTAGSQTAAKVIRKIRGRHREDWLTSRTEEIPQSGWRYSSIFGPENSKHRTRSRNKHSKHSGSIPASVSPQPPGWNPFIPVSMNFVSPTCPRCSQPSINVSQDKFAPYPVSGVNGYYVPYTPYSVESIPSQMRQKSVYHHHHSQLQQQQMEQSYQVPQTLHSPHRHQRHHLSPPYPSPYASKYGPHGRWTMFSPSMEYLGPSELNGTDRTVDLMEIEYAADTDGDKETYLSSDSLNLIVKLAKEFNTTTERLEEIAKQLKLALDMQLGEKWHVVIGDDSFGSNLASLPGALANFKLGKNVFLVWQT